MNKHNEELLKILSQQKEMLSSYEDVLYQDTDKETGKLTSEHLDTCSGCSLCEL
jgi:hypothetical protein